MGVYVKSVAWFEPEHCLSCAAVFIQLASR
jgi:hypothetical protein